MRRFLQMVDANGNPALPGSVANLVPGGQPWPPQTPGPGVVKEDGPTEAALDTCVMWYEWCTDRTVYTFSRHVNRSRLNIATDVHPSVVSAINRSAAYEAKQA